MLSNFAQALLHGAPLIAPGEAGENALELANGAYLSALKDDWQKLPVDGEEYDYKLEELMRQERASSL